MLFPFLGISNLEDFVQRVYSFQLGTDVKLPTSKNIGTNLFVACDRRGLSFTRSAKTTCRRNRFNPHLTLLFSNKLEKFPDNIFVDIALPIAPLVMPVAMPVTSSVAMAIAMPSMLINQNSPSLIPPNLLFSNLYPIPADSTRSRNTTSVKKSPLLKANRKMVQSHRRPSWRSRITATMSYRYPSDKSAS